MPDGPNFNELDVSVPEVVKTYPLETRIKVFNYLVSLGEHEKNAYRIAANHLGTSFNIIRSNGYKEWSKIN